MTHDLPNHEPHTWWWHRESDGRSTLYPRMTLEKLGEWPVWEGSRFRCVRCKAEGTAKALQAMSCADPGWYHGDIREYRRNYTPVWCRSCRHEWIVTVLENVMDGHQPFVRVRTVTETPCPACGATCTEEIPS